MSIIVDVKKKQEKVRGKIMYVYESHLGGLYVSDKLFNYEDLYCKQCGDSDTYIGCANTKEEAWRLLKDIISICEFCPHEKNEDWSHCDECENLPHYNSYTYNYIENFIDENWE